MQRDRAAAQLRPSASRRRARRRARCCSSVQRLRDREVRSSPRTERASNSIARGSATSDVDVDGRRGSICSRRSEAHRGTPRRRRCGRRRSPRSRLASGTGRAAPPARVQLQRCPTRLRAQLVDRLRAGVVLEEPDRDQRRDEPGEHDAEQEERRQPEAQRPEHGEPYALRRLGGSRAGLDLVADAPDRHDRRRVAELAAQLAHVHVDRARVARERVAPDALEQLVAREHEPAMVEQLPEQVELLRRELDLLVADAHLAPAGVDREVAVPELLALALARARASRGAGSTCTRATSSRGLNGFVR